jgi:hypothetical protein
MRSKLFVAAFALVFVTVFSMGFMPSAAQAAEDVNPFRVQLNVGVPEVVGLGVEFVLPIEQLDNRLAFNLDYSSVTVSGADVDDVEYKYYSLGLNYYLTGGGEGLYVGASYGNVAVDITDTYTSESLTTIGATAEGKAEVDSNLYAVKIGYRAVKGILTFGAEVGYASGDVDDSTTVDVTYTKGIFTETLKEDVDTSDVPDSGAIGKIFIGIAF